MPTLLRAYGTGTLMVLLAVVACEGSSPPATNQPAVAADSALQAAVGARDLERIMTFYAPDASLLPTAKPIVIGVAAIRKEWTLILAIPDFRNVATLTRIDVARSGDLAYSMGTYAATLRGENGQLVTEPGKWLSVWRRQSDGAWRIVVDTYNTDIPPPDHK